MKRHYFIGDDLSVVATIERELLARGIAPEQIHVLCSDDAAAERHQLHDVQSLMKKDVIRSAEVGALIGAVASIAVLAGAYLSGLTLSVGWIPFVFLAIVVFGFSTWEGGLIGMHVPNSRFRRFAEELNDGKHLLFVDAHPPEEAHVRGVVADHPQLRHMGTGSSSPRWLVGLQTNARRFFQWGP